MRLLIGLLVAFCIAALVVFTIGQKKAVEPEAIEANDMCSFCRMSISEKRYAAELIDDTGQVFKFDDIGCMANFINQKRNNAPTAATFVMDFESREWMKAENAFYVRSAELKTPMNNGLVAFKNQSNAEAASTKYRGTVLSFGEVTK